MKYLKNYFYNNSLNFNKFRIGDVSRVYYWIRYKKKKRLYSCYGLYIVNKKNTHFRIINTFNTELFQIKFPFVSPAILQVFKIFLYQNFFCTSKKLYFKKKVNLKWNANINTKHNMIWSSVKSWEFNFFSFFRPEKKKQFKVLYRNMKKRHQWRMLQILKKMKRTYFDEDDELEIEENNDEENYVNDKEVYDDNFEIEYNYLDLGIDFNSSSSNKVNNSYLVDLFEVEIDAITNSVHWGDVNSNK